ncbi:MAG: type II toxin-antitoxin system RelE/ParE family toxin [Candidatus Poribacteria bacterium]|nr:type II toxin-antitoxin system RelE/ParE family toxin [Candidatus Poribacteria bacterium]
MRETIRPRQVIAFVDENGRVPFDDWLSTIRDRTTLTRIEQRIVRVQQGNLGDHRSIGDGVSELRLHFGPGYRIYFGEDGDTLVILLCGGDKSGQSRDISQAKRLWRTYLESSQ